MNKSTILITGSAGYLGRELSSKLTQLDYNVIGIDRLEPQNYHGKFYKIDFSTPSAIDVVFKKNKIDFLIHSGSIHPNRNYSDAEYLRCNIEGSWYLIKSAIENNIKDIVLTSSICATGHYVDTEPHSWPITEDYRSDYPVDIYSLTKQTQEEICKHFAYTSNARIISLRPSGFIYRELSPKDMLIKLLHNGIWIDDLISAHVKAIERIKTLPIGFYPYWTVTNPPIPHTEWKEAKFNFMDVIRRNWPTLYQFVKSQNIRIDSLQAIYNLERIKKHLNWQPKFTIQKWMETYIKG